MLSHYHEKKGEYNTIGILKKRDYIHITFITVYVTIVLFHYCY